MRLALCDPIHRGTLRRLKEASHCIPTLFSTLHFILAEPPSSERAEVDGDSAHALILFCGGFRFCAPYRCQRGGGPGSAGPHLWPNLSPGERT